MITEDSRVKFIAEFADGLFQDIQWIQVNSQKEKIWKRMILMFQWNKNNMYKVDDDYYENKISESITKILKSIAIIIIIVLWILITL